MRSPVAVGLRHDHEVAPSLNPAAVDQGAMAIPTRAGHVLQMIAVVSGR